MHEIQQLQHRACGPTCEVVRVGSTIPAYNQIINATYTAPAYFIPYDDHASSQYRKLAMNSVQLRMRITLMSFPSLRWAQQSIRTRPPSSIHLLRNCAQPIANSCVSAEPGFRSRQQERKAAQTSISPPPLYRQSRI